MLLILTGFADGTIDFLVDYLDRPFFRFNLDDYRSYEFEFTPEAWSIRNPAGLEISSESATRCLWWKLFLHQLETDKYIQEEIRIAAQNLYSWFIARGLVIGNPPFLEVSWGKLRQASVASKYFKVPKQAVGWGEKFNQSLSRNNRWVVKSLSAQLTSEGKAIFTTEISPNEIDSSIPWYFQEKVDSDFDITVLVAGKQFFSFRRDRSNLSFLDWRKEQFSKKIPWECFELTFAQTRALKGFIGEMGVSWGRLDFLLVDNELVFLEINPNGQWVFLDPENKNGVISAVADYFLAGETH